MSKGIGTRLFLVVSGILFIIFGIYTLYDPLMSLVSLILVLGIFLTVGGLFMFVDSIRLSSSFPAKAWYIINAILTIVVGLLFLFGDALVNISALAYVLLFYFIFSSIIQIYIALSFSSDSWSWLTILLAILVICLSIYALFIPGLAVGILTWSVSLQFIFSGIALFVIASRLRKFASAVSA